MKNVLEENWLPASGIGPFSELLVLFRISDKCFGGNWIPTESPMVLCVHLI